MAHVANLTIDGTTPSATHTNYPKLIRGQDFPAGVWSTATASGGDIRIFLSDGTTEVAREIVSFDATTPRVHLDGVDDRVWFTQALNIGSNAGDYFEVDFTYFDPGGSTNYPICGIASAFLHRIQLTTTQVQMRTTSGNDASWAYSRPADGTRVKLRVQRVSTDQWELFIDDVSLGIETVSTDNFQPSYIGRNNTSYPEMDIHSAVVYLNGAVAHEWLAGNADPASDDWTDSAGSLDILMSSGARRVGETAEIHCLIPTLTAGLSGTDDTVLQVHADGVSSDYAVTDTYGRNAVWVDYAVVLHLDDLTDSTGNTSPTSSGVTYSAGQIGNAARFNGTNSRLDATFSAVNDYSFQFTAWVNSDVSAPTNTTLLGVADKDDSNQQHRVVTTNVGLPEYSAFDGSNRRATRVSSALGSSWHWIGGNSTAQTYRALMVDGSEVASNSASITITDLDRFTLGTSPDSTPFGYWAGLIDEARLRWTLPSADWITDEYADQSGNAAWHTITAVGGGVSLSPDEVLQSITIDGITLTQEHIAAIQEVAQSQTLDGADLTQAGSVTTAELAQAQTVDTGTLVQAHVIGPNGLDQPQSIDSVALTQAGSLSPEEIAQGQLLDTTLSTQAHIIVPLSALQSNDLASTALQQAGAVLAQDVDQALSIDEAALIVSGQLSAFDVTQDQVTSAIALTQAHSLAPIEVTQGNGVDAVTVTAFAQGLDAEDIAQVLGVDESSLTQFYVLSADSLTQNQIIDIVIFGGTIIGSLSGRVLVFSALSGDVVVH